MLQNVIKCSKNVQGKNYINEFLSFYKQSFQKTQKNVQVWKMDVINKSLKFFFTTQEWIGNFIFIFAAKHRDTER